MKNENTLWRRSWRNLRKRWNAEDYPGAEPRFHFGKLAKDIGIFLCLPLVAALVASYAVNHKSGSPKRQGKEEESRSRYQSAEAHSQIINFGGKGGRSLAPPVKRAPGALVRVRLLNVVETYSTAPVHAQIVDAGLGTAMTGGTLIGDASPDTNFERISISFRFARDPGRESVAFPISARALSLDGTFGLEAAKKESFLTRAALGSAGTATQDAQSKLSGTGDFAQILLRALTAGLTQEFGDGTQVEKNRAEVLTLQPQTEFFAELTDYFGGSSR
jgi:hypothetical protein